MIEVTSCGQERKARARISFPQLPQVMDRASWAFLGDDDQSRPVLGWRKAQLTDARCCG
jgi:hypothetical protein